MSGLQGTAPAPPAAAVAPAAWRTLLRDRPLIPLLVLLVLLIVALQIASPGILNAGWAASTLRLAIPLAILAACQTLAMLTGGIDLSVAMIASTAAYITATQAPTQGPVVAIALAMTAAILIGLANGIGIGIFRVHPLIMTLAMGLVALGLLTVYQVRMVSAGVRVPEIINWLGARTSFEVLPNSLLLFVPLAAIIIFGLRRSGYGRLLYAVGDNETAARLAGVRIWAVLLVLYVISALLAGIAGLLYAGATNTATLALADRFLLPSVAAAVIGGTSIFGGRGGYAGSIVGALILTVLTTLLTVIEVPLLTPPGRAGVPEPVRQILFGAIILAVAAAYTRITEQS